MATVTPDILATYLDPIAEELTPQLAQRIVQVQIKPDLASRVEELGQKSNTNTLTSEERAEYQYYVDVNNQLGLLQARARRFLMDQTD